MATKRNKILLVSILGLLALTGCSKDVASYPAGGPILPQSEGNTGKIYNNELKSIYEDLRDGALAGDVLNKLLYNYATTIFGRFSNSAPSYSETVLGEITLSEAHNDASKLNTFIEAHKAYWPGEEKPTSAEDLAVAKAKVDATYEAVENGIAEALYNKISSGTYSKHNIFNESKFLAALHFEGKKVVYPAVSTYEGLLDPEVEAKDVFKEGFLTKANYWDEANGITYAIDENIESIYSDLLIQQYIVDESKSTIGRSSARKVNVLAITASSEYVNEVPELVKYVVHNVIAKKNGFVIGADDRHGEKAVKEIFDSVGKIVKGVPAYFDSTDEDYDARAYAYVDALSEQGLFGDPDELVAGTIDFLKSTEYGSMMKDYLKIKENLIETDTSIESDFTGSGSYTVEKGKVYKEREISLKKYVTTGWHIQDGGLTSLPESIRSRLFNASVSNAMDQKVDPLTDRTDDAWTYESETKINKYVAKVNGAYFLKRESVEQTSSNDDLYFYDSSSKTYYIVQIVEAVSSAKLGTTANSYAKVYAEGGKDNNLLQETIQHEVCEVVAEKSSYSGLAKEHWLEEMAIKYHDTTIRDYFKSNYPDLFD